MLLVELLWIFHLMNFHSIDNMKRDLETITNKIVSILKKENLTIHEVECVLLPIHLAMEEAIEKNEIEFRKNNFTSIKIDCDCYKHS